MVSPMAEILVFVIGAVVGSFLNVCIYRIPKKISIVYPLSHCPACKKNILWYDNIPILGYLILKGRCRYCKAKIRFRYFVVEALTASLILLFYIVFGPSARFFSCSILSCGLIVSTFVDLEIGEIPDEISLGGLAVGLVFSFAFPSALGETSRHFGILNSFLGALAGGGSIYLIGFLGELVFKKEAMGGGDVKLMAMIGAFLGWKLTILTFFIAPVFGSIFGIILRIKDGREIIPYGPHLSLAAVVAIFFGDKILKMFLYGLF